MERLRVWGAKDQANWVGTLKRELQSRSSWNIPTITSPYASPPQKASSFKCWYFTDIFREHHHIASEINGTKM